MITSIKRDFNLFPNIVGIVTTDDLAVITAPGYFFGTQSAEVNLINNGVWQWEIEDFVLIYYATNLIGWFTYNATTDAFVVWSASNDLPTVINSSVLITTLSGVPTWSGPLTNGQVIIGSTGASPMPATITAGAGIGITNSAGGIMVSSTNPLPLITDSAVFGSNNGGVGTWIGPLTNGQVVIGNTGNTPDAATISGGTGISVVNGAGTITISATGDGLTWSTVTTTTQAMAINNGYVANNAGLVTFTLPATASVGSVVRVAGLGAGGWQIAQNSGQVINVGTSSSTTGVTGYVASTFASDSIELICIVANTTWQTVVAPQGNITVH